MIPWFEIYPQSLSGKEVMPDCRPVQNALVLYKIRPALVTAVGEKVEIKLESGVSKRVRPKDITLLHPGPLSSLSELHPPQGDFLEAWELLAGEETTLEDFAELVFGEYTPASAWFAWQLVAEGLYFEGSPEAILTRPKEAVGADLSSRKAKADADAAWDSMLERLGRQQLDEGDRKQLSEVERVALGKSAHSRILKALGHQENPTSAHRMLTKVGYWQPFYNPYPERHSVVSDDPLLELPAMASVTRQDLTHLAAFAIDDEGSNDPDDAVSLEGDRIWVHVADVSGLVQPDSAMDKEARERGANLYLPEGIVHMLPPSLTTELALGLHQESPALSIGFQVGADGMPCEVEVVLSRVKVTRHTYGEIDRRLDQAPFATLKGLTKIFQTARKEADAATIDLPEVSVKVLHDEVMIRPLDRLGSREVVTEAMLMAGSAVAQYAQLHQIPLPFATQPPPAKHLKPEGMVEMYAFRRQMKPSRQKITPESHSGLGLAAYVRATSPLRRYLDLVTHQQLRAHLLGEAMLDEKQISERIAISEVPAAAIRRAERQSNQHWKLVYLKQVGNKTFDATVVELDDRKVTAIIPELALETKMRSNPAYQLGQQLTLGVASIDLEELDARFRTV